MDTNEKVETPVAEVGVVRFVGNSEDYSLDFTIKLIGNVGQEKELMGKLINVISVKKGFSYGVKGLDDLVHSPLPARTF